MILLPGFAAAYVVQMLALRHSQTDFDKVIEACLYSFLIYASFVVLAGGALPFEVVPAHLPTTEATIRWLPRRLAGLAAITAVFSVLGVLYINLDGNLVFRKLRITERTTRRAIWNDILEKEVQPTQIVQVELSDGRSILGLLIYYSDSADDCSLYIGQASWVGPGAEVTPIPGPGILITRNAAIQSISLLDPPADDLRSA
jgi:hypothetical protein